MPIQPKIEIQDDPSLHRLEGSQTDFRGGLVIKKEVKKESDSARSNVNRQSLLGLDRLAEEKRREKLEKEDKKRHREYNHDERKYRERPYTPATPGISDSIRENIARQDFDSF